MIRDILNRKKNPAVTSDRWHVIHARWTGKSAEEPRFARSIVSEHEDRDAAVAAARKLVSRLRPQLAARSREDRDQVLVRRPHFKSLKNGRRIQRKP